MWMEAISPPPLVQVLSHLLGELLQIAVENAAMHKCTPSSCVMLEVGEQWIGALYRHKCGEMLCIEDCKGTHVIFEQLRGAISIQVWQCNKLIILQ